MMIWMINKNALLSNIKLRLIQSLIFLLLVIETTKELKLYSSRKEEKPVIIEKASNFYKIVSESKEVTKMYSMLSGCMHGIKMEFTEFIKVWNR